jgi:hypothetical protein
MWPFKKKSAIPDRLPIDGPWSVAEGQNNGRAMIVRSNAGYLELGSLQDYEHQVGIAVPFRDAQANGLPSAGESAQLNHLEDAICSSLEEQAESLLVAIITTGGMREFVFYTRAPERVKEHFDKLRNQIATHTIQLMIQSDPRWRVYSQLAKA